MIRKLTLCATVAASLWATPLFAKIIQVPADQSTIQAGINAATNGDTVLVSAGTYYEQINFNGKAIVVRSQSGSKVTIIDGLGLPGPVVIFGTGETTSSVLQGFTIQNGSSNFSTFRRWWNCGHWRFASNYWKHHS
jgi:hypothetical protein